MEIPQDKYKYGIVVDSGSSGSRIQVYKWADPKYVAKTSSDEEVNRSPPKIEQEANWTLKTSPGISTFSSKSKQKKIWSDHYSKLAQFADGIIPKNKQAETPVFVLATAGMRLLPKKQQKQILSQTCSGWRKNTKYAIGECDDHFKTIDGETEGVYGWLALNFLMGKFNNVDQHTQDHESIGFMDMGGASTQIAFKPSAEQVEKHQEDLYEVALRDVNGITQSWNIFVQTWLGFGANEARKRFLKALIDLNSIQPGSEISDPCLPKGATVKFEHNGSSYKVNGIGNYNTCVRTIYPLLSKHIPCKDEPCLFNGVHGPKMDFENDKFVGISEYWYTANDVFSSGGEYNYHAYNERVKEYCESDWSTIVENSKNGGYNKLDPEKFLLDACFKASWVINILHEGFELPRIGIEAPDPSPEQQEHDQEVLQKHVPFKSADSIDGKELSWTLGRILLYASSEIPPNQKKDPKVGIYPSALSGKKFVPAGALKGYESDDDEFEGSLFALLLIVGLIAAVFYFGNHHKSFLKTRRFNSAKKVFYNFASRVPYVSSIIDAKQNYHDLYSSELSRGLEEGTLSSSKSSPNLNHLRTRSNINLSDAYEMDVQDDGRFNFLSRPFPKRNVFFMSQNNSKETLNRTTSSLSVKKSSD